MSKVLLADLLRLYPAHPLLEIPEEDRGRDVMEEPGVVGIPTGGAQTGGQCLERKGKKCWVLKL